MSLGVLFWILFIVALIFGAWGYRGADGTWQWRGLVGGIVLWVLLGILGWHAFGGPVR